MVRSFGNKQFKSVVYSVAEFQFLDVVHSPTVHKRPFTGRVSDRKVQLMVILDNENVDPIRNPNCINCLKLSIFCQRFSPTSSNLVSEFSFKLFLFRTDSLSIVYAGRHIELGNIHRNASERIAASQLRVFYQSLAAQHLSTQCADIGANKHTQIVWMAHSQGRAVGWLMCPDGRP